MHIGSVLLIIWLAIGGVAAGQRGDYNGSIGNCSRASTIAVMAIAGPLNYVGVNPKRQVRYAAAQQLAVNGRCRPC